MKAPGFIAILLFLWQVNLFSLPHLQLQTFANYKKQSVQNWTTLTVAPCYVPQTVQNHSIQQLAEKLEVERNDYQKSYTAYDHNQKQQHKAGRSLYCEDQQYNAHILSTWSNLLQTSSISAFDNAYQVKLVQRITALQKTIAMHGVVRNYRSEVNPDFLIRDAHKDICFYGTELDKTLFQELQATQQQALALHQKYRRNLCVATMVPVIIDTTIQAQQEQDIQVAFAGADKAHQMLEVLQQGMLAIAQGVVSVGTGVCNAVKAVMTVEHWKEVAKNSVALAHYVAHQLIEYKQCEEAFDDVDEDRRAAFYTAYAAKSKAEHEKFTELCRHHYQLFCAKPWEQKVEAAAELLATVALESVIIHAAVSGATAGASRLLEEAATVFKKGSAAMSEYGLEVAGVGTLVAQEGEEVVITALKEIEKTPEKLLKTEGRFVEILGEEVERVKISPPRKLTKAEFFDLGETLRGENVYEKYCEHIFSDDHIAKGIMNLGKTEEEVVVIFTDLIYQAYDRGLLRPGLNQIQKMVKGYTVEARAQLKLDGTLQSFNGMIGNPPCKKGAHLIKL